MSDTSTDRDDAPDQLVDTNSTVPRTSLNPHATAFVPHAPAAQRDVAPPGAMIGQPMMYYGQSPMYTYHYPPVAMDNSRGRGRGRGRGRRGGRGGAQPGAKRKKKRKKRKKKVKHDKEKQTKEETREERQQDEVEVPEDHPAHPNYALRHVVVVTKQSQKTALERLKRERKEKERLAREEKHELLRTLQKQLEDALAEPLPEVPVEVVRARRRERERERVEAAEVAVHEASVPYPYPFERLEAVDEEGDTFLDHVRADRLDEVHDALIAADYGGRASGSKRHLFLQRDEAGRSALHVATQNGALDMVRVLLASGVDPSATMPGGLTPLHLACALGLETIVSALVQAHANVNAMRADTKDRPIHFACRFKREGCLRVLIRAGAKLASLNEDDMSPLLLCVRGGWAEGVYALERAGVRLQASSARSGLLASPLHHAIGKPDMVEFLLRRNVSVLAEDATGATPLHWCCRAEDLPTDAVLESARLLVGVDQAVVVHTDLEGRTPLHVAALHGKNELVALLLEQGASLDALDNSGMAALACALSRGHTDLVRSHLSGPLSTVAATPAALTKLLFEVCATGDLAAFEFLLEVAPACDLAAEPPAGQPSLIQLALAQDQEEIAVRLVEGGAPVTHLDLSARLEQLRRRLYERHVDSVDAEPFRYLPRWSTKRLQLLPPAERAVHLPNGEMHVWSGDDALGFLVAKQPSFLQPLIDDPSTGDVHIRVQEPDGRPGVVFGHRVVLGARSSFFETMLFGAMARTTSDAEPITLLPDLSRAGCRALMEWLYCGRLDRHIAPAALFELMALGSMLLLDPLLDACAKVGEAHITADRVNNVTRFAERHGITSLVRRCRAFQQLQRRRALVHGRTPKGHELFTHLREEPRCTCSENEPVDSLGADLGKLLTPRFQAGTDLHLRVSGQLDGHEATYHLHSCLAKYLAPPLYNCELVQALPEEVRLDPMAELTMVSCEHDAQGGGGLDDEPVDDVVDVTVASGKAFAVFVRWAFTDQVVLDGLEPDELWAVVHLSHVLAPAAVVGDGYASDLQVAAEALLSRSISLANVLAWFRRAKGVNAHLLAAACAKTMLRAWKRLCKVPRFKADMQCTESLQLLKMLYLDSWYGDRQLKVV